MHHVRYPLVAFFFVLLAPGNALGFVQPSTTNEMALPGRLYVQFTEDHQRMSAGRIGIDAFDALASRYSVTDIKKAFPSIDVIAEHRPLSPATEALRHVYIVHYDAADSPDHVAQDLESVPAVRYAEPIYRHQLYGKVQESGDEPRATPNDLSYAAQTHLPFMRLNEAWDVVKGSDGSVVIGIVDGGTQWQHVDLAANVWTNPNEIDGDGIDNDNNGYVDDIHGWNFTTNTPDPTGPANSENNDHGTEVAGAAAAVTDNSIGIAGASWNAKFMGLNASCTDQDYMCHTSSGTLYASLNGADVITASYGGYSYSATEEMVYQAATDEGSLVVAAAGNLRRNVDFNKHYPSGYTMVLSVGATRKNSDVNVFNYGKTVNVFAPGQSIEGTVGSNRYSTSSGTSYAAPLAAGVAALVKTAFPSYNAHQLREQIRLTAVSIDHANTYPGEYGSGKVDAYAAVTTAPQPGLRVSDWSYQTLHGNQNVGRYDVVDVKVTFTNYHGLGSGLSAELSADADYVTWLAQTVSLGSMGLGDTREATFRFSFTDAAPNSGIVFLSPTIKAPGFEDSSDLFSIRFNEIYDETNTLEVSPMVVIEADAPTVVTVTVSSTSTFTDAQVLPITVTGSGMILP